MLLSIIVPIYNAEKFLERCINSLLAQGLHSGEYEILLINDGSTDNSLAICLDYRSRFPDVIKVFSHGNQGVAYTRNRGMEEAEGEYICFVDADDYLIPGGFRYLAENHLDDSLDILSYSSITLDEKTKREFVEDNCTEGQVRYETNGWWLLKAARMPIFIWNSWFKRRFLCTHHIIFTQGLVMAEDALFNLHVYLKNPRTKNVSSCLYRYDLHTESAIHHRDSRFMKHAIDGYLILIHEFSRYINVYKTSEPELSQGLRCILENQFIPFMSRVLSSDCSTKDFLRIKRDLLDMGVLPLGMNGKMGMALRFIFSTPFCVRLYEWGYQHIFIPFVLPKLSRN